ncbi:hypothetical protein GJ496_010356 [Pomphorhynchus laevis]|nr:hypothetical protein GJ496_001785 [Pomphorhynchus laevis]KAI0982847.1 hypothetical protein GJ496_002262 [Pomphorhynchus laevis]KAI0983740.1 hypothetical protein GJ496_010354 [Pomphorhynchus laevis]KAI0983742.1 hypothetical protein GJ496_010356 [Pomphorhynchus laevis]
MHIASLFAFCYVIMNSIPALTQHHNSTIKLKTRRSLFINEDDISDKTLWLMYPSESHLEQDNINHQIKCGGIISIDQQYNYVRFCSPGYPYAYPSLATCYLYLKTIPGKNVLLNITDFHIRRHSDIGCSDSLEIRYYNVWQPGPSFCGETNKGLLFVSYKNDMMLKLKSGTNGQGAGFCASVSTMRN